MKEITVKVKSTPDRVKRDALEKADLFPNEVAHVKAKIIKKNADGTNIYLVKIGVKQGVL